MRDAKTGAHEEEMTVDDRTCLAKFMDRLGKMIDRWCGDVEVETTRSVAIGEQNGHVDNTATTSKYTLASFIPVALFGQFRRFANLYFLVMGMMMLFGEQTGLFLSPYPAATTLGPLLVVISVSLLQEALTDLARHRADAEVNRRATDVLNPINTITQSSVRTGMIARVMKGDMIPADLVILATSAESNSCYIDTASIDGETSLKIRRAPLFHDPLPWMVEAAPKDEQQLHQIMSQLKGSVECDPPNEHINSFTGTLQLSDDPKAEAAPLGKDHVVLRGSSLHTEWLLGVAVYTGEDTKLALNARTPPQKLSQLDKTSNRVVLAIFGCQIALALMTSIAKVAFEDANYHKLWYVGFTDNRLQRRASYLEDYLWPDLEATSERQNFFWSFCTFLILYVNFIPLSLYVSLELTFLTLVTFVNWDIQMYHDKTNTPALARSPTVTDLGQVQYIFSDKTGTLTRNEMKLRRVIVDDVTYAVPQSTSSKKSDDEDEDDEEGAFLSDEGLPSINVLAKRAVHQDDEYAAMLLESLVLCNTVVVENKNKNITYQAESPDEGALVDAAKIANYLLVARTEHVLACETPALRGARRTWQILATNDFDNDRKRMSIFVREQFDDEHAPKRNGRPLLHAQPSLELPKDPSSTTGRQGEGAAHLRGRILLLCKGADNAMFSVAAATNHHLDDMRTKLDDFARQGLRTLVFGVRVFEDDEFDSWRNQYYLPAMSALNGREEMLKRASHEAESLLTIIGATAIEDKLQVGVPDAIATLAKAGIKLWVLTGDKRETAIEIGKSCRLLKAGMPMAVLSSKASTIQLRAALLYLFDACGAKDDILPDKKDQQALEDKVSELRSDAEKVKAEALEKKQQSSQKGEDDEDEEEEDEEGPFGDCEVWEEDEHPQEAVLALVIDGEAMTQFFGDRALETMLFRVLARCGSIIACRVTPKQKAQLVKLVQEHVKPTPVTLAIGDGANDVNMIMSAQVGVGISGHEGLQAVNASDFAIAQFRYLLRLLLVHGRWGYRRVCVLVLYSFYKNACLAATLFIYCNFTGYSGTSLFSDYFTALFNFFLFLMIFYTSILDQDVSDSYVLKFPQLYASGRENQDLGVKVALQWISMALIHACLIFFLPAYALKLGTGDREDLASYQAFGAVVSCGFINYMNLKVLFETRYFTKPLAGAGKQNGNLNFLASTWFAAVFNVAFFYCGLLVASVVGDGTDFIFQMLPFWNTGTTILADASTWGITFLVMASCATIDFVKYAATLFFFPDPIAVSIERCRLQETNRRKQQDKKQQKKDLEKGGGKRKQQKKKKPKKNDDEE